MVLVTGTAPQEGKTTTIVNLARLLAGSGEKTVVVDCDLRRAQMHQRLQLPREPGFTDFFVRHEPVSALVRPASIANLFVLTAGPLPPNPPALLARKSLGDLFDELRAEFEWVLIDSPPLASVTDALLLARHADLAVLVVQHNKVDKKLVKRSVVALRKATPNLLGAVLNVVDVRARSYQYYYYPQRDGVAEGRPKPSRRGRGKGGEAGGPGGELTGMARARARLRLAAAVSALGLVAVARNAAPQAPAPPAPAPRPPGAGIAIGELAWADGERRARRAAGEELLAPPRPGGRACAPATRSAPRKRRPSASSSPGWWWASALPPCSRFPRAPCCRPCSSRGGPSSPGRAATS